MRLTLSRPLLPGPLLFLVFLLVFLFVAGAACSRGRKGGETAAVRPGSPDCYKIAGASACPPDSSDPSGRKLPQTGARCSLPECQTCGSPTTPTFRDATGAAQTGWCICVEKSDGSGVRTYSCGAGPWGSAPR